MGELSERHWATSGLEFEIGLASFDGDEVLIFADDFCLGFGNFWTGLEEAVD